MFENLKENIKDSKLIAMDVRFLCRYIPNHDGIEFVKKVINNQT